MTSGYRESTESWAAVLRDLQARGLRAPRLLMADGNAAIWAAARAVWPESAEQRCWNHKMSNVLDRLPKREQPEAKDLLRAVVYAPSRSEAVKAREAFTKRYGSWYPKAVGVLEDDWERMLTFYVVSILGPTARGLPVGAVQRHVRERIAPNPDAAPSLRAPLGWEMRRLPRRSASRGSGPASAHSRQRPNRGRRGPDRPNACPRSGAASSCQRRRSRPLRQLSRADEEGEPVKGRSRCDAGSPRAHRVARDGHAPRSQPVSRVVAAGCSQVADDECQHSCRHRVPISTKRSGGLAGRYPTALDLSTFGTQNHVPPVLRWAVKKELENYP